MARLGIDPANEAFALLVRQSQDRNIKLRDLAGSGCTELGCGLALGWPAVLAHGYYNLVMLLLSR